MEEKENDGLLVESLCDRGDRIVGCFHLISINIGEAVLG
jgi:hypothetical protein